MRLTQDKISCSFADLLLFGTISSIIRVSFYPMAFIIAGLGNPGDEYKETRHNTGRIMLETIAKKFEFDDFEFDKKTNARLAEGKIGKQKVLLVAPETFMNKSGNSLKSLVTSAKKAEDLIVIYDDFQLPLGRIKLSFNRSSGGHNGLESVIKAVKTEAFLRIRVGVSPETSSGKIKMPHGPEAVEKFILGPYKKPELDLLKKVAKKVAEAVETAVVEGREKAMTEFNQA
jgi:peptidyl-tRNA hydrolase, PTH1 family